MAYISISERSSLRAIVNSGLDKLGSAHRWLTSERRKNENGGGRSEKGVSPRISLSPFRKRGMEPGARLRAPVDAARMPAAAAAAAAPSNTASRNMTRLCVGCVWK